MTSKSVATAILSLAATNLLAAADRPNIVWISGEDTSQSRWSCYGDPVPTMPTVDSLAKMGVRYTNAYASAAISAPVRSGIITGMYQTAIGCHPMTTYGYMSYECENDELGYTAVPPHYVKAFTEYLRASGYFCTNRGKTHYQFAYKNEVPKSIWDLSSGSAHFRNRPDKSQPFFAVFNSNATHGKKNLGAKINCDVNKIEVPPYYIDNEHSRAELATHYDNMATFDKYVAGIIKDLKEDGSLENTIIFLWSDHGTGLPRGKRWLYDSGTQIPLVVIDPRTTKGRGTTCDDLVSTVDFAPTVLSLAGVPIPTHMQGVAQLGEQKGEAREYVYSAKDREDDTYDMIRSVRNKRFLYLKNYYTDKPYSAYLGSRNSSKVMGDLHEAKLKGTLTEAQKPFMADMRAPEELYDVVKDPHNIHNLASDPKYKKVLESMRQEQLRWAEETVDLGLVDEDLLKRRYFPDGEASVTCRPHYVVNHEKERFNTRYDGSKGVQRLTAPASFSLFCSTQGASLIYRIAKKGEAMPKIWSVLVAPVKLECGEYTIEARAHRYGYKESPELKFELIVQ